MHNNPHHSDSDEYDPVRRRSSVTDGALAYAFARAQEIKHYHPTLIDCNEIVNIGGGDGTAAPIPVRVVVAGIRLRGGW